MKKINLIWPTLLLAALLLTACGEGTAGTGTDYPPPMTEAPATDDVTDVETTVPAEETTTPGIPVTGSGENLSRLSQQLDLGVWNESGEQLGEVDDMVLDLDNARVSYVVVGAGGFLGLGEKDVLIPWDSLQLQTVAAAGGQESGFIYDGDPERFSSAPDWDLEAMLPEAGAAAGDWDAEIRSYWVSGVLPPTASPDAAVTAVPEMTATASPAPGAAEAQPQDLQGVMLASDALGASVTLSQDLVRSGDQNQPQATETLTAPGMTASTPSAAQGEPVRDPLNATVEDMIVDPESGAIRYIVIDALFDDGERWIPVPLGFLQWDGANQAFVIDIDLAALQNAPFFLDDQFPDTTLEGWNTEFENFWANPAAAPGTEMQATPMP